MAAKEITQFSMQEALTFQPPPPEHTKKQQVISDFVTYAAGLGDNPFEKQGGADNILRVRVIQHKAGSISYEYALKMPVNMLMQKRAEAEAARRKAEVLAKVEELRSNPKEFEKFVKEVVADVLGRSVAIGMLKSMIALNTRPVYASKAEERRAKMAKGQSSKDHAVKRNAAAVIKRAFSPAMKRESDFERAVAQDRRQRGVVAAKAAAEFRAQSRKAS